MVFLGIIAAAAVGTYLYVFRTDTTDMSRLKPDFQLDAAALFKEFESGEADATARYGGKILEVRGKVESKEANEWGNVTITFVDQLFGVTCTIDSLQAIKQADEIKAIRQGDSVTVKGRCDGMLTDVKLVKCALMGGTR